MHLLPTMKYLRALGLLSAFTSASLAGEGLAAQPTAEEIAVAQQLYHDARQQQTEKQWASCENSLKRAIDIVETPGLRFHLAFCKEQQHRWVEALVDYRRASELIESGVEAPDVEALLPEAIAELDSKTPRLSLVMDARPTGAELFLDGKRLSAQLLAAPIPVDPGLRRVEVAAPGYTPFAQAINMLPNERRELRVQLVPTRLAEEAPPAPAPRATPPIELEDDGVSAQAIVLASEALLTLGALGVGVGFTSEAASRDRDREGLLDSISNEGGCANGQPQHELCPAVRDADRDAARAREIATVGYAAAGVGAVAFIATWLLWPDDSAPESALVLDWGEQGATLGFRGVF